MNLRSTSETARLATSAGATREERVPPASYRADIDGLRAVAILAVLGFHAFPDQVPGGFVGVDVFFVISGYLITRWLLATLENGTFSLWDFYGRRIRRLFPALAVVLGTCYLIGWFALLEKEFALLGKHIAGGAAFVSNLVLWREAGYFDAAAQSKPLLHLWSLGIEEQYYIAWPLIVASLWSRRRIFTAATAALLVLSFVLNLARLPADPSGTFYLPFTRLWELLVGGALAQFEVARRSGALEDSSAVPAWRKAQAIGGLALIAWPIMALSEHSAFPGWAAAVPVIGTALVIAAGPHAGVNQRLLSMRGLVWIGLISYPLYLWHWPLITFARIVGEPEPTTGVRFAVVLTSFALAAATFALVERPFRAGARGHARVIALAAVMVIIGGIGYVTHLLGGIPQRLPVIMRDEARPPMRACGAGFPEGAQCWGSNDLERKVLLIGDSHGAAFAPGVANALHTSGLGVRLVSVASGGCMPLPAVESFNVRGRSNECRDTYAEAYRYAREDDSIVAVLIVGRWASRVGGATGFREQKGDAARGSYSFDNGSVRTENADEVFDRGLRLALSSLGREKRVVFLEQIPELGLDPNRCRQRPLRPGMEAQPADCSVPLSTVLERQRHYREIATRVLAEHPLVTTFDPVPWLCRSGNCVSVGGDGRLLYRDDDHLSVLGATLVARWMIEQGALPETNSDPRPPAAQ